VFVSSRKWVVLTRIRSDHCFGRIDLSSNENLAAFFVGGREFTWIGYLGMG